MINYIRVKTSNIEGTGATFYDMKDNTFDEMVFEKMFGASFSGDGIIYNFDRNTLSVTVSSERLSATGDVWQYDSVNTLSWPVYGGVGYTKYTGSFTSVDDGFGTTPVVLPGVFQMNSQTETTSAYVSTNGFITFGSGSGAIISTPQQQTNPAGICGNPSDQWLQQGLTMTDGDKQDVYFKSIDLANGKYGMSFLVYQGTYGSSTTPKSYLLNIYRDSTYQWVETRAKNLVSGRSGPYNAIDVSQPSSTTSRVWRGNLLGQDWTYLGTGTVI